MPTDFSLKNKHALVCGASAGIGRAIAVAFAEAGATVTVLARRAELLTALAEELKSAGAPEVFTLSVDLDELDTAVLKVSAHVEKHGPVHVLVNNTGGPPGGPILQADPEAFTKAFGRHVLAAHQLVRAVLPGMTAAGYGRILNVTSTSVREPIANLGVSNTTRAAVAGWAKSVSKELPPGITINNLLPGFTDTERLDALRAGAAKRTGKSEDDVREMWLSAVPEGRLGRPEELAAAAVFLASPAGSFVRGVSLAIDGGRMVSI